MGKSRIQKRLEVLDKQLVKENAPTHRQYINLQEAFDIMNRELFDNKLPPVFITFQRQKKSYGYYWHNKLVARGTNEKISEIALAINQFGGQHDKEIFSTLLHEMVHHKQFCFGKPSPNGYHNYEWAYMMKDVGLMPSTTGEPGGKETGQKVSHYIIKGGKFDTLYSTIEKRGISIDWQSFDKDGTRHKGKYNKTKYTCPCCNAKVWGGKGLHIVCDDCSNYDDVFVGTVFFAEEESEGGEES